MNVVNELRSTSAFRGTGLNFGSGAQERVTYSVVRNPCTFGPILLFVIGSDRFVILFSRNRGVQTDIRASKNDIHSEPERRKGTFFPLRRTLPAN